MATKSQHRPEYQPLPELLRELRLQAGIPHRTLAEQLGKAASYVAKCESGERRVDVIEFAEWCRACDVDPSVALETLLKKLES